MLESYGGLTSGPSASQPGLSLTPEPLVLVFGGDVDASLPIGPGAGLGMTRCSWV